MNRQFYLNLAASGLRMPIGTDLLVHEQADPQGVLHDSERLARVIVATARRFKTPLAIAPMDLTVEKHCLVRALAPGMSEDHQFTEAPPAERLERLTAILQQQPDSRMQAAARAMTIVAKEEDLVPIGMTIGPFSLMTKLLADPITPVYLAGSGVTGDQEPEIELLEQLLEAAVKVILHSVELQVSCGVRAMFVAEPAANVAYISPVQMEQGSDIFDRFVMAPNRRIKQALDDRCADLLFHCCGEITNRMLAGFCQLDPAILSLGCSRKLWEDAAIVPKTTVLFGNLPSKKFFSDAMTVEDVRQQTRELLDRMKAAGHPFILGTECDVLHVSGCELAISQKIQAMLDA